jgi:hypothetical protein
MTLTKSDWEMIGTDDDYYLFCEDDFADSRPITELSEIKPDDNSFIPEKAGV